MRIAKIVTQILILILLLPELSAADEILNDFRIQRQDYPSAVRLANGNFAVGWGSFAYLANGARMNIFTSDFTRINPYEIQVSELADLSFGQAILGASSDGFIVAIFARYETSDSLDMNLYIRKFDYVGDPLTGDIRVNNDSAGQQWPSTVLINDSLDYILILWESIDVDNPEIRDFYFKQLDFNLNCTTDDIIIYNYIDVAIIHLDGALIAPSRLMAVWGNDYYGINPEIYGKTINIDGSNPSDVFVTHVYSDGFYRTPSISNTLDNGVIVVWGNIFGLYEASIWGRRFDINGLPVDTTEILLSIPDADGNGISEIQSFPSASQNSLGNYAISWRQIYGDSLGVFKPMMRYFDANLVAISDTIKVNNLAGNVHNTANLFLDDDNLLVCWSENMGGDFGYDILGTVKPMTTSDIYSAHDNTVKFGLSSSAYPNPFNSTITIELELFRKSFTSIELFDILGRRVNTLLNKYLEPGNHQIIFNADDLPSGTYFCRIQTDQFTDSKKLTLLK